MIRNDDGLVCKDLEGSGHGFPLGIIQEFDRRGLGKP
jgi:hypothetical protein